MKKTIGSILVFVLFSSMYAQKPLDGIWQGNFVVGKEQMLFVLHISEADGKLKASFDMPAQMLIDFKNTKITSKNDSVWLEVPAFSAKYSAARIGDSLKGIWLQQGEATPISLGLTPADKAFKLLRPQTPQPPFPYISKDVTFRNSKAKIYLAGTLTIPDTTGIWPVVVLVSGSGAQDRNEELLKHQPFFVIADYLTRNGIAVLRYDDRGVGQSEGIFATATTFDFNNDASAAVSYLAKLSYIDAKAIGVIGHSEGGIIAMMQASQNKKLLFAISLAGVTVPCSQLLVMQQDLILEGSGVSEERREVMWNFSTQYYNLLQSSGTNEELRAQTLELLKTTTTDLTAEQCEEYGLTEAFVNQMLMQTTSAWFKAFVAIIPSKYVSKIRCNFLALNGSSDVQVPADANIEGFNSYIVRKQGLTLDSHIFPGLNHLFQPCKTGMPGEYATIETTIDPVVLQYMVDWIKKVVVVEK